jgi:hypothetical protein
METRKERQRRLETPPGLGWPLASLFMLVGAGLALGGGSCAYSTGPWNGERLWAPQAMLLGILALVAGLAIVGWAWRSR